MIPARNEADVIAYTIGAARRVPGVDEIVVVDDGSDDGTAEAASGADSLIRLKENVGKGGALNRALETVDADVLLLLDADLGDSAEEATKLLEPVLRDEADMTVAVFVSGDRSRDTNSKLEARSQGFGLVMKTSRLGIRLMTGRRVASPLAGPRAVKREIIDRAGGFAPRFGVETALTIDALRMGYRVLEVPVEMVHRPSGRDLRGFMHRGRQMADVLAALARKAVKR